MSDLIIEDIPLTKKWLADVIEKKIGVKPNIGTSGIVENAELGYMSIIRKVQLHFSADQEETHENLPKYVVLKIANSAKGASVVQNALGTSSVNPDRKAIEQFMHNTECNYYNVFSELDEKPMQIPKVYFVQKANDDVSQVPVIVMEMFENCKLYDLITGFNKEQLFKIIDELVKLHVFSLTTENWKTIVPDKKKVAFADTYCRLVKQIGEKLAKNSGLEILSIYIRNSFDKDMQFLTKYADEYLTEKRRSVLVHGDLWAPQIIWDRNDNIAAIVDWQATHRGGPMEDFHHILSTCTSIENRKTLTKPLLDYYFNQLSIKLKAMGAKMQWTRDEIEEEYKHTFLQGAAKTVFANGFWSNSPVLQTDGQPDPEKIAISFARCKSYVEEAVAELNMS